MYLEYDKYKEMGGTLDKTAFNAAERRARYLINSQANGRTGKRIIKLTELPQAVTDCIFELIELSAAFGGKQISGESQSQGGASESYSYAVKTDDEINTERQEIIETYLNGVMYEGASVLYRGACV